MKFITKDQIKIIHLLLAAVGKARSFTVEKPEKESLVKQYSNNRVTSTTGLYYFEAEEMIAELQRRLPKQEDSSDKMRKKIIHYFRQQNYEKDGKADMQHIEGWVKKYGYLHKGLNEYTQQELPRLVSQAESAYKSYLKAI